MVKRHSTLMLALLRLGDLAMGLAAWALACFTQFGSGEPGLLAGIRSLQDLSPWVVLSLVLTLSIFSRLGLYEPKRTRNLFGETSATIQAILLVWMITYALAGLTSREPPAPGIMGALLAGWVVLGLTFRLAARALLRRTRQRGWNLRYAAIVGTGKLAQKLYHALERNPWTGIQTRYFVEDGPPGRTLFALDVVGPKSAVSSLVVQRPVDIVFVALRREQYRDIEEVLSCLGMASVAIQVVADTLSFHFLRHDVYELEGLPIIELTSSPQHGWNSTMKRFLDLLGSAAGLVLLSVPMALIAAAVKWSSRGAIFYCQTRSSTGGKPFKMIKFRTMVENAEVATGPVWAEPSDRRVTKVGRLLRRTSLDELPQLFNVLMGRMSLVGPRPERPEFVEQLARRIPRYMLRHHAKAGLTGWAQVHGFRGKTSLRKRIQYDLYYITNWSFALDLWILVLTLFRGFIHKNAY